MLSPYGELFAVCFFYTLKTNLPACLSAQIFHIVFKHKIRNGTNYALKFAISKRFQEGNNL